MHMHVIFALTLNQIEPQSLYNIILKLDCVGGDIDYYYLRNTSINDTGLAYCPNASIYNFNLSTARKASKLH